MNRLVVLALVALAGFLSIGCGLYSPPAQQRSASGVTATTAQVTKGSDGLTIEQRNVRDRLTEDNKPGAIKHLYVISAYSGQVLIYSTVRGKITSSGKRLMPSQVSNSLGFNIPSLGNYNTELADQVGSFYTTEILGDDGTYGSSVEYVYWWDSAGIYHQHYVQGGQILHVASAPLAVKSVVLNMELQ